MSPSGGGSGKVRDVTAHRARADQTHDHQPGDDQPGDDQLWHELLNLASADPSTRTYPAQTHAVVSDLALTHLRSALTTAARMVLDDGVRYASTGPDHRGWHLDPLPLIIPATQWAQLEAGMAQRAELLDLILTDVYGERSLIHRGLIPAEVVLGHPGFVPQLDQLRLPGPRQLLLTAADLGRDRHGEWTVLTDRCSTPSGAGYAMANRRITSRVMAGLRRRTQVVRVRRFFHQMTAALQHAAPDGDNYPHTVVLSPGTDSDTAFEDAFLATLLGFPLTEAEDLTMRDGRLWVRAADSLDPVDVVLRRVEAHAADPLELASRARVGVPGLIEATRRGAVSVVNPIGAGVLDNPGLLPFLPALARRLLDADLAIPSARTWWCGDPSSWRQVRARLHELVVLPLDRGHASTPCRGWLLSADRLDRLRARIEAQPGAWCAQERLPLSGAPVITSAGLQPHNFILRTFAARQAESYHLLPGGLGRVSGADIGSQASVIAKDVWVLAPDAPTAALSVDGSTREGPFSAPTRVLSLPARVTENLFWVGRYCERAEGTARLLRMAEDLNADYANRPDTPGAAAAAVLRQAAATITSTRASAPFWDLVHDVATPGTVAHALSRLVDAAQEVRDHLSQDIWHVLARLDRVLAADPGNPEPLQRTLRDVLSGTLAVAGITAESMVRDASWGYIDAGMRLERVRHTVALVRATLVVDRSATVDGQVAEAVLEVGESGITHRRRTAAGEGPVLPAESAVWLLLLDATNPRSVDFQLSAAARALATIGDHAVAAATAQLRDRLSAARAHEMCAGAGRPALAALLDDVDAAMTDLSARMGRRHFRRMAPQRALLTDWSGGVEN